MFRLFKSPPGLWSSSESDDEESSSEDQNLSSSEQKKAPDVDALIKELRDILKAESATDSSSQKESSSSLENNEPKEDMIKEYNFETKPAITNIKEKMLTPKNWRNRIEVIKNENFSNLKKIYFDELNDFINKWRLQEPGIVLNPIKESNLPYAFSDIMSAISTELRKTDVKPLLLLKVLYYFFSNFETLVAENATLKTECVLSLKKCVTNSLKCKASKHLLKDMAADILSELGFVSLTSAASKLFACNFRYLQEFHKDLYGTTVAWLCNVTPETGAKLLHSEAEFSDTLAIRASNYPKTLRRLILVCESSVCCSPDEMENLSLLERINMINRAGVSQMEIDGVSTQKEDVSSVKRKPFYDRNLVKNVNDLIRNKTIYTPIFHFEYDPRITTPNRFLNLMLQIFKMRHLENAPKTYLHMFAKGGSQAASVEPKNFTLTEVSHNTDSPQNFFVTEPKESYMNDYSFWSAWDIFSDIETPVDTQLAYFGHTSALENLKFDPYSREKANTHKISTDISDMDPMNIKVSPNVFDSFKMPDSYASFQKQKPPRKRKVSPSE